MSEIGRCTFCGQQGPIYRDGRFRVCEAPECDREYNEAMRDDEAAAREDAERDDFARYRSW